MSNPAFGLAPNRSRIQGRRSLLGALTLSVMLAAGLCGAALAASDVVLNGQSLDDAQRKSLERQAGHPIAPGRWWYDARSGLWGPEGGAAAGLARTGIAPTAPLPAGASRSPGEPATGVFFNGRELHGQEVRWLMTLGPVWPGRYWLDGWGNVGLEGQALPFANLHVLAHRRSGATSASSTTKGGTWIASGSGCTIVAGKSSSGIGSFGASTC